MPTKRQNTRKKFNGKKVNSKKQANSSLKLVLNRLDKIDQRLETLEQNTVVEFKAVRDEIAQGRQETAIEFKVVRGEMAQGLDAVRGEMAQGLDAMRGEMAQGLDAVRGEVGRGFAALRQDFKVELKHVSDAAYEHYL